MTIAIAWIRTLRDCEELIFVSDSRLSGDGLNFDACPKVLTLPRSDCAIAFAGYTGHAYPMMQQLALAIDAYAPARRGSLDVTALKSHALKVFDGMKDLLKSSPGCSIPQSEEPSAEFLFGGYSWVKKRFELWKISFNSRDDRFEAHPAQWLSHVAHAPHVDLRRTKGTRESAPIARIALAGDQSERALNRLRDRMKSSGGEPQAAKLDMQPFEVVRDMLRDPNHAETIGGAPQLVKVYQYMQAAPLAVFWPSKASGSTHLQGRPCLGYERIDRWIFDPDTLRSERPAHSRNDIDDDSPEAAEPDA